MSSFRTRLETPRDRDTARHGGARSVVLWLLAAVSLGACGDSGTVSGFRAPPSSCAQGTASCNPTSAPAPAPAPAPPACATAVGDRGQRPIDLIWIVDSSFSMKEEMGWIQQNVNDFVDYLLAAGIDARLVLLGGLDICVPPPIGGPDCADSPRLRHVAEYVGSHDSLEKTIALYPKYRDVLRPDSRRVFIVTTDDESEVSSEWFKQQLDQLEAPGFPQGFVFNSIVSFGTHPRGCLTGSAQGSVYLQLTQETNGAQYPICAPDWTSTFAQMGVEVAALNDLTCSFAVPGLPEDQIFDAAQTRVRAVEGQQATTLPERASLADCQQQGGWYFEPAPEPQVRLCPESCKRLSVTRVEVDFGCSAPLK